MLLSQVQQIEPEAFVRDVLVDRFAAAHVVTGYDFHFGRGRKGNAAALQSLGKAMGFAVSGIEQVTDEDGVAPIASSAVRAALRHGLGHALDRLLELVDQPLHVVGQHDLGLGEVALAAGDLVKVLPLAIREMKGEEED